MSSATDPVPSSDQETRLGAAMSDLKSQVTVAMKPSLRLRLTTSFSIAILIPSLIISLVGILMIQGQVFQQAQSQVTSSLSSAREIYSNAQDRIRDAIRMNATRRTVIRFLSTGDTTNLAMEMQRVGQAEKLDILTLTDTLGRVLYRERNPRARGDDQSVDQLTGLSLHSRGTVARCCR